MHCSIRGPQIQRISQNQAAKADEDSKEGLLEVTAASSHMKTNTGTKLSLQETTMREKKETDSR